MLVDLVSIPAETVVSGGCTIAYRMIGRGPLVLLLMGLGADGIAWQSHASALADRFCCVIPDNRGVGLSEKPAGPYSTAQMADDCAVILSAIGAKSAAVIGISMGGAIGQELALRYPSLVSSLMLVSSWARCDDYLRDMFDVLSTVQRALRPYEFAQMLQLQIWSAGFYDLMAKKLRHERETSISIAAASFAAQCAACKAHDRFEDLDTITVPTLVTGGQYDRFTVLERSLELARRIPGAQLRVFPGGHVHHWEMLEQFNTLLKGWLEMYGSTQPIGA